MKITALAVVMMSVATAVAADEIPWVYATVSPLGVRSDPPIPNVDVQLVVDDDSVEGAFGVGTPTATQFMWFNRFSPGPLVPLRLDQVWVLFPAGANMTPGAAVEMVLYLDPDGDPGNGANLLATYDETIQVVDGSTFSVYELDPPVEIHESGDLLIGVVDRFVTTGVTSSTTPAALDTDVSAGRSWLAVWSGDPPSPPILPADALMQPVDGFVPGNWMIRAFGDRILGPAIPTLSSWRLALLAMAVAGAGVALLRRR